MTKKHFVALTLKLVALRPRTNSDMESDKIAHAQWYRTVLALADFCQSQNAQFDRERFLAACGIAQPVPVRNGSFTVKHTTRDVWGVDDND